MPVTDSFERLPLDKITVKRNARQRATVQVDDLVSSIKERGVLHPIIVHQEGEAITLVTGERRLAACRALGLPDIIVRWAKDLSHIELQIIELEENIKREDITWKDRTGSIGRIHTLFLSMDSGWTIGETAEAIGLTGSTVSVYLAVNAELGDEKVASSDTVREAYNLLKRREQRAYSKDLEEILGSVEPAEAVSEALDEEVEGIDILSPEIVTITDGPPSKPPVRVVTPKEEPQPQVICEDFLKWAPAYTGQKFNLIHCDFPFGIGIFDGEQGRGTERDHLYKDTEETFQVLLKCLCENFDKLASCSCHLMFWYSARPGSKRETFIRETFRTLAPSLDFSHHPLIWLKSDNSGIASDARRSPRHIYETCALASRGARQLVRTAGDAYSAPTDKRLHPSAKPEPMLRHFMQMLVDESTVMLDPTCGSGSALRAAESLGARKVLGLEVDPQMVEVARLATSNARLLREAARKL